MKPESKINAVLTDVIGTKDLLKLVVQKITDQLFLYGIAIILILVATYYMVKDDKNGMFIICTILFVYILSVFGYVYLQQKGKVEKEDPKTMNRLLSNNVAAIQKTSEAFGVKVWTGKKDAGTAASRDISISANSSSNTFRIGDKILVHYKSDRDGYLTLLNIGTSGKLTVLFPNNLHQDNYVKANTEYTIPGPDYGFDYVLEGPAGKERLKAIVTLEKTDMQSKFNTDGSMFYSSGATAAARDIAIIKNKVETMPAEGWAEGTWDFTVEQS